MNSNQASSNSGGTRKGMMVAIIVVLVVAVIGFLSRRGGENGNGAGGGAAENESLTQTRVALAATENLETSEADGVWNSLFEKFPQDESVALNRAINRTLHVDALSAEANNPSLAQEEQQAARDQLVNAIPAARTSIDEFGTIAKDDQVTAIWLRSRIDLQEAGLLRGSLTKSLRKGVFKRLAEVINGDLGKQPESMILGGPLIETVDLLEDPIDGLPQDVVNQAAQSLAALARQHPDNLFFAIRAALLLIKAKDKQAAEFVASGNELSQAIEPSIRKDTQPIGLTPDELVEQLITAINSEEWQTADTKSVLWFNVLNKTEIVKTDRRRASPHPLDRLSFESLRRLSSEMIKQNPLLESADQVSFANALMDESANALVAAIIDFDLDLTPDLASLDESGNLQLWLNDGKGTWKADGSLKLDVAATGLLVADLFEADSSHPKRIKTEAVDEGDGETDFGAANRHNTFASLVAYGEKGVRLIQLDGRQSTAVADRLSLVDSETGLEDVSDVITAVAGDLEADGDLDLVFATKNGVRMFVNRGNRTFFEIPGDKTIGVDEPVTSMAIADFDRDLDLDIVFTQGDRVGVLENLLHLQFRARILEEIPAVAGANSVAVEDVDGNVSWDFVVGGQGGCQIVYSQTSSAGSWTVDHVETSDQSCSAMVLADFDNDSWLELVCQNEGKTSLSRIGPWGFGSWQQVDAIGAAESQVAADFQGDGVIDLSGVEAGKLMMFENQLESPGHHLDVRFKGIADNASGRVNHYAIGSVLECRFGPHYRARVVTSPVTHFGVADFDTAGSVRVIFPNGLTQTVRDPKVDSLVEEEQTLKGSCPYLYSWDGDKFVFQTDCLWAAPLGLQVARGVVAQDRPWEYLKIDGDHIKPHGDHYEFRITEELWEVAYFDKVALTVVDHPEDTEIWTNEKVGPGGIATPTIFAFEKDQLKSVDSAYDTAGREVTAKLQSSDQDFVQGFDRRLRQGLCPPHWIDLNFRSAFETIDENSKIYLVLTGWIMPTDTSLNIQIDQNPELGPIEFPSVSVPDQSGEFQTAIPFMGFPGGKTKTIVVDVTEVANLQDPRFRIRTSAQIYWDRAAIAVQSGVGEYNTEEINLLTAEVAFHGFSAKHKAGETTPETYDYQQVTEAARWPPLRGSLTRFGDCLSLLREWDDSMVVISSGDEIRMTFSLPKSPLPQGWRRDFVLHSVGWDKDADLNTLEGQSTGPLPYREMTEYPPRNDPNQNAALERLNHPHLQRFQSFRSFWYRQESEPNTRFLNHPISVQ